MRIITSNNCLSAGDALRDIDQRGVVRSDPFILVSGDVVSNIDLKSVIKQVRWRCRDVMRWSTGRMRRMWRVCLPYDCVELYCCGAVDGQRFLVSWHFFYLFPVSLPLPLTFPSRLPSCPETFFADRSAQGKQEGRPFDPHDNVLQRGRGRLQRSTYS